MDHEQQLDFSGIFKKNTLGKGIGLLGGLALIGIFLFLHFSGSADPHDVAAGLTFGGIVTAFCVLLLFFNRRAYFHLEDGYIRTKYHWFGSLACSLEDVDFALAQGNSLTILCKNGRRHVIMGLENARMLCTQIRRQQFCAETQAADVLRAQLDATQKQQKKAMYWVIGFVAMMFVNIFIAVALTGGRDLSAFHRLDWILFGAMGVVELFTVVILFFAADRCGKFRLPVMHLKYRLRCAILVSHPLPSNRVRGVYMDEDCYGRIVVCGFPNDESVYYCVQELTGNYLPETTHTSKTFESEDELPNEALANLLDISQLFCP